MNDNGLIRQYITLAAVVLVAIFVLMQIQWPSQTPRQQKTGSGLLPGETVSQEDTAERLSSSDLRTGGVSRSSSRRLTKSVTSPQSTAATSTAFQAATSTPFQRGQSSPAEYQGVNVEFQPVQAVSMRTAPEKKSVRTGQAPGEVDIAPGNSHPDVTSDLKISGRVLDDIGEPIKDLSLTLKLQQASVDERAAFGSHILNALTDTEGNYTFLNLVEGDYLLCTVEAKGYKAVCQSPRAPHSSADFSLRGTRSGRVYGMVKNQDGEPLVEVSVSATPGQNQRAITDEEGKYSLPMTVNSKLNYQLYFTKQDYSRQRVAIGGADILKGKEQDASLEKTQLSGFDITGSIFDQTGAPVSGRMVTLYSPTVKSAQPLRAASDAYGEFTIKYVQAADDYRLSVNTGGTYTFDASAYNNMEIYDGMTPLRLEVQGAGQGSFSARVITASGDAVSGETFALYSGSAYVGRVVSDSSGEINFKEVPVKQGGSALRISGGSSPKYTFSGMNLAEGEHKSGLELVVDRGDSRLELTVLDEKQKPLAGAQGILIWSDTKNGVRSQTLRSRGKISMADTGNVSFSELGLGKHNLQVRLKDYIPFSKLIDISQLSQREQVVLVRAEEQ